MSVKSGYRRFNTWLQAEDAPDPVRARAFRSAVAYTASIVFVHVTGALFTGGYWWAGLLVAPVGFAFSYGLSIEMERVKREGLWRR